MSATDDDRDARFDRLIGDYLAAADAGRAEPPEEFLRRHPEFRADLERFFAAHAGLARLAGPEAGLTLPGVHFDGYELLGVVGRGGVGVVYRARQKRPGRVVALKVLHPGLTADGRARARFRGEAEAAARLDHPHVVPIYQVGEHAGVPFLAMRLMPGGDLSVRLPALAADPRVAAELLLPLAGAVEAAHRRGILHRDLKPANVLLDADGRPHLSDFGLAVDLAAGPGLTGSGELVGTPQYMAPEQAGGRGGVTPATDVHGLGAVLYAALTGRPPFPGRMYAEVLDAVRRRNPDPPRRGNPRVPRDLDAICRKCLEKDPVDRYPSAGDLADDLRRFLAGRVVVAQPVPRARQAARLVGRYPGRAAAMLAALVAMVGVAALVACLTADARRAGQAARELEYDALLGRVRERAVARPPGWTWDSLADLRRAAGLDTPRRNDRELRSELARAVLAPDVRPAGAIAGGFTAELAVFDPSAGCRYLALGERHRADGRATDHPVHVALADPNIGTAFHRWKLPANAAWESAHDRVDGVRALAATPDGRWLVAGLRGGGVFALDVNQPDTPPRLLETAGGTVRGAAAAADGRSVYVASDDGVVARWAVGAWGLTARVVLPGAARVELAVSPIGGAVYASAFGPAGEHTLYRLDPNRLDVVCDYHPPSGRAGRMIVLPGGRGLVSAGRDGVGVYDPWRAAETSQAGPPVRSRSAGRRDDFESPAADPAGRLVAVGTDGEAPLVRVFDPAGLTPVADLVGRGGTGRPAFDPTGRRLAVAAAGRVELYEVADRGVGERVGWSPHPVRAFGFPGDGRRVATLTIPGTGATELAEWSVGSPGPSRWRPLPECPEPGGPDLAADPAGDGFAVVGRDGVAARVRWAGPPVAPIGRVPAHARAAGFGPDGVLWAAGGPEVAAWGPGVIGPLGRWVNRPPPGREGESGVAALAAGRHQALAAGEDGFVTLLALPGPGPAGSWEVGRHRLTAAALSPSGGRGAAAGTAGEVSVLDLPTGHRVGDGRPHRDLVTGLAFLTEDLLVSGSWDGTVAISRVGSGVVEVLLTIPAGGLVERLQLFPDGVTLGVLVTGERSVRVWRLDRLDEELAGAGLAVGIPASQPARPAADPPAGKRLIARTGRGLWREVFATEFFTYPVAADPDDRLIHDWGEHAPHPWAPTDHFSVQWSGYLRAPCPGRYRFRAVGDDRVAVWVDGEPVVRRPGTGSPAGEGWIDLTGRPQAFRVEAAERSGVASAAVLWSQDGGFGWRPISPWVLFQTERAAAAAVIPADPPPPDQAWVRAADGEVVTLAFGPGGDAVAGRIPPGQPNRVRFSRLDGRTGEVTDLAEVDAGGHVLTAPLSGDGSLVALLVRGRERISMYRTSDGSPVGQLSDPRGGVGAPQWAGDRPVLWFCGPHGWGWWDPATRTRGRLPDAPAGFGGAEHVRLAGETPAWVLERGDGSLRLGTVSPGRPSGRAVVLARGGPAVAADRCGRRVATGTPRRAEVGGPRAILQGMVTVYDLTTGTEVVRLYGHTGRVNVVAVSPDGKRVLSASLDGTVRMWDVPSDRGASSDAK